MRNFYKFLCSLFLGGLVCNNVAQGAPLIGINSHGHDVVVLQDTLQKLNYSIDDPRGFFKGTTEVALKAFQRDNNLEVTGRVDRITWQKIEDLKWGNKSLVEPVKVNQPKVKPEPTVIGKPKPAVVNKPKPSVVSKPITKVTTPKKGSKLVSINNKNKQKTKGKVTAKDKNKGATRPGVVNRTWENITSVPMGKEFITRKDAEVIIKTAKQYMGVPYVFGGNTPQGFDCSGYLEYVFAKHNMKIPRTADVQYELGRDYPVSKLEPGDLVFFSTYEPGVSHCGIYLGNRQFIHASTSKGVRVDSLDGDYWGSKFYGGKKIVK